MIFAALALSAGAFAQEKPAPEKPTLKWYGFVRTYFAFDTRESSAGTGDLYFYMPKDVSLAADGTDINAVPSLRYMALTSRLGLDIAAPEIKGYKIGGKIEADFYAGISGRTGTAQFRLRQAFVTIAKNSRSWKIGQAWHPMAIDLPDIFSLESGAPFGPFSRTPQVTFDWKFAGNWAIEASAIWQMQYTSTGPEGNSANYILYGCTPEGYFGFHYKNGRHAFKIGGDVLSIKPRRYEYDAAGKVTHKVDDRLTGYSAFIYGQTGAGAWTLKGKVIYAQDGSHFNLVGGYGVSEILDNGSFRYSTTNTLAAWITNCFKFGNWNPQMLVGYSRNFGTFDDIVNTVVYGSDGKDAKSFWCKNSADKMSSMYRIQPEVIYNIGKLQLGLEYMMTAVHYGKSAERKVAVEDLHWVYNHRIQALVKFNF